MTQILLLGQGGMYRLIMTSQYFDEILLKINCIEVLHFSVYMDDVLMELESDNLLGLVVDNDLFLTHYVDNLCHKITLGVSIHKSYNIQTLSKYCNSHRIKLAYYGLILTFLNYGVFLINKIYKG